MRRDCCPACVAKTSESNFSLLLIREGQYPLYDVQIQIHDIEKRTEIVKSGKLAEAFRKGLIEYKNQLFKDSKIINVGNLGLGQGRELGTISLPKDADQKTYHIYIFARNGEALQFVQFRRIDGNWKWAEKTLFNNEVVNKYIPSDFPRDDNNKYIWEE